MSDTDGKQELRQGFAHPCSRRLVHNSPKKETTKMSINGSIDKQNVVYTNNEKLQSLGPG